MVSIVAVVDEVMRSTPQEMRESLLSLGATKWEATHAVRNAPPGLRGIIAAVVLGFSRAFGETLAVLMVAGNVAQIPRSIFDAAYSLPALIANNYGEMMSVPLYESALMSAALLLLIAVIIFNISARAVIVHLEKTLACSTLYCALHSSHAAGAGRCVLSLGHASQRGWRGVILCVILAVIAMRGAQALSWEMISSAPSAGFYMGKVAASLTPFWARSIWRSAARSWLRSLRRRQFFIFTCTRRPTRAWLISSASRWT